VSAGHQFSVYFKEPLAEANSGRYLVVDDDRRLAIGQGRLRIGVHAYVARIAHQEERRQVTQGKGQSGQSAPDAHDSFGAAVTARAERHQVGWLVRLFVGSESAERDFVMDVVSVSFRRVQDAVSFGKAAVLAAIALC